MTGAGVERKGIFISYRRGITADVTGRLFDRFKDEFGADGVFMDAEGIRPGEAFPERLRSALAASDVVVVMIGQDWMPEVQRRRGEDERDWVVHEVEIALGQEGTTVIPILVHDADMPPGADLPPEIAGLADCNAFTMRSQSEWGSGVDRLIQEIRDARSRSRTVEYGEEQAASAILDLDSWAVLKQQMEDGWVVPVLGPGALTSSREVMATLSATAKENVIPTELLGTPDVPLVAQAISVRLGPNYPHKTLRRSHGKGGAEARTDSVARVIARLPLKTFVTTGFDDELEQALEHEGKTATPIEPPRQNLVDGGKGTGSARDLVDFDEENPAVMHLFGTYGNPKGMVLNEDDLFDLYIAMDKQGFFDAAIREHLAESQLLFIGFSLHDWRFRLLLRGLARRLHDNPEHNIAVVQLDPDELPPGHDLESGESFVGKYLQSHNRDIDVRGFIGSAEEFAGALLAELAEELEPAG